MFGNEIKQWFFWNFNRKYFIIFFALIELWLAFDRRTLPKNNFVCFNIENRNIAWIAAKSAQRRKIWKCINTWNDFLGNHLFKNLFCVFSNHFVNLIGQPRFFVFVWKDPSKVLVFYSIDLHYNFKYGGSLLINAEINFNVKHVDWVWLWNLVFYMKEIQKFINNIV